MADEMISDKDRDPVPKDLALPPPKLPKMLRKMARRKYVEVLTIRDGKGKGIRTSLVAASAKDNRLENVIVASKLRSLVEGQIDLYQDGTLTGQKVTPKDLLELSQALEKTVAITYRAHGDVSEKDKIPDLPPVGAPVQNNQTNIGTMIVGGGQTGESMGDILGKVGQAAAKK